MTCVSVYVYMRNIIKINNEMESNNRLVVINTSSKIDGIFKEVNNIFRTIELMPIQIGVSNGDYTPKENLKTIFDSLTNMMTERSYIEEIILIRKDTDTAITSKGTIDIDLLFNSVYFNPQKNISFWQSFLYNTRNNDTMVETTQYINRISGYNVLKSFVAVISENNFSRSDFEKIVLIDEKKVFEDFSDEENERLIIAVYNAQGDYIFGEKEYRREYSSTDLIKMFSDDKNNIIKDGHSYFYKSDYNRFIYRIDFDVKTSNMWLSDLTFIPLLYGLLLGIVLAFVFSNDLNRPLRAIKEKVKGNNDDIIVGDTVTYIEDKIAQLLAENTENADKISVISEQVKNSMFISLVSSRSYYNKNKQAVDTVFGCIKSFDSIIMIALDLNQSNKADKILEFSNEVYEKINYNTVLVEESEYSIIFIIGFNISQTKKSDVVKHVSQIISKTNGGKQPYSIVISSTFSSLEYLYDGYSDIKMGRGYHIVGKRNDCIDVDEIDIGIKIYNPDEVKNKIYNYILMGKKKDCIEVINNIIDTNINNGIYYTRFKMLVNMLSSVVADALLVCEHNKNDIFIMERAINTHISNYRDINPEKIKSIFANTVRMIEIKEKRYDDTSSKLNKEEIIKYINENYDKDLYLENMADIFSTTPKYFSNYFSRKCNKSFTEYLTEVRITKAMELMKNQKLKIVDIAVKVGYTNASTFTNAFKKYTGVSPTIFRELNKDNETKAEN